MLLSLFFVSDTNNHFCPLPLLCPSDAADFQDEMQEYEETIYTMEHDLDVARQERKDLERINEELERMIWQMQETDRKNQQTIKQYQEQNRNMVLSHNAHNNGTTTNKPEDSEMDGMEEDNNGFDDGDDHNGGLVITEEEITKLNARLTSQPQNYKDYSHADNPNNPFSDADSDDSDWDAVDLDEVGSGDEQQFEVVATDKRSLNQSLAAEMKKCHLEDGLEAFALGDDEIEELKRTHYDKQATLDALKSIERKVEIREKKQRSQNATLQMVVEEEKEMDLDLDLDQDLEGGQGTKGMKTPRDLDEEESLSSSWDHLHGDDVASPSKQKRIKFKRSDSNLDRMISPALIAASSQLNSDDEMNATGTVTGSRTPSRNFQDNFKRMDTVEHMLNDCDLESVGMDESEARKILRQLMTLKTVINTPTMTQTGLTPDKEKNGNNMEMNNNGITNNTRFPYKRMTMEGAVNVNGSSRSILSIGSTSSTNRNALQTFQHSWKSSTMNLNGINGINNAMIPAFLAQQSLAEDDVQSVSPSEDNARITKNNLSPMSLHSPSMMQHSGSSSVFPEHSKASKSRFALKKTTGSLLSVDGLAINKQHGDMLDSMVSNQIVLKLQQTQLEAAITKSELLDELKTEVCVVDPAAGDDSNELEVPRISALMRESFDIDRFADELQK